MSYSSRARATMARARDERAHANSVSAYLSGRFPAAPPRHVCALFGSEDEEYRVLLPFKRDGFDAGHKAVHVINPDQRRTHLARLAAAGIDTAAAETRGQLEVRANTDIYLRDGRFDQDRMLDLFTRLASGNASHAFALSRIVCRMDWAAGGRELVDGVIEFESRLNEVWRCHDDAVICTYQLAQFSGDAVIDIMRTHPLVLIGGLVQHNPFFVPPEQFIHDFRARRSHRAAAARRRGDRESTVGALARKLRGCLTASTT